MDASTSSAYKLGLRAGVGSAQARVYTIEIKFKISLQKKGGLENEVVKNVLKFKFLNEENCLSSDNNNER